MLLRKKMVLLMVISIFFTAYSCVEKNKGPELDPVDSTQVEHPEWSKNASIYEINVRQYSQEGTFEAVREDLSRIKSMGVRILWFMPIHPIGEINRKGTLGSPYSIKDYKAVNPEYGTMDEFKSLVAEAQGMGFKIIIDWVANHTSWDNPWTENVDWYVVNEQDNFIPPVGTDWTDVIQLDYENAEMREAMHDALRFWVEEIGIDGYRCDVAYMVPTDFWNEARKRLDEIKPVFMLAEANQPELHKKAFDMSYAWEFKDVIREIANGTKPPEALDSLMQREQEKFPENAYRMYFTTNHDENSWHASDVEMYGPNFENFAVLAATIDGMPLIYNGQESELDKQIEFFEKDAIEWKNYKYQEFYADLIMLKRDEQALWNGKFGGEFVPVSTPEGLYAFKRIHEESEVVVALNFTDEQKSLSLSDLGVTEEAITYNSTSLTVTNEEISFGPHQWVIFVK